jgi:hypothetical protein
MYVFSIDIPFKGNQSLANRTSKVTAVSYLHSGVIDTAVTKLGEYKVDLLREYWSILKKALTRVSVA